MTLASVPPVTEEQFTVYVTLIVSGFFFYFVSVKCIKIIYRCNLFLTCLLFNSVKGYFQCAFMCVEYTGK